MTQLRGFGNHLRQLMQNALQGNAKKKGALCTFLDHESARQLEGSAGRGWEMKVEIGMLYKADGRIETVHPHDGKKFSLQELQGFVSGSIELIPHSRPYAYCHEEGRLDGLPENSNATSKFKYPLCGDVIQVVRGKEKP
jgi:hypothetical protein